jgi:F0F1-type ATP synthase epsilon subunit
MASRNLQNAKISVSVLTISEVLFRGEAWAVSSYNLRGAFDILPMHSQFITLIERELILHLDDAQERRFKVTNGVMLVMNDQVKVFVGF